MGQRSKELFLKACGLTDSRTFALDLEGPGEGEVVSRTFARPFAVIGRDPNADLVLDHPQVSARHAYLQVIAGRVYCVDLGSRSGVAWEKGPGQSGWVDRTWGVRIGPFWIRAGAGMGAPDLEDPLAARSFGAPGSDGPALSLEFPQHAGKPPWRVSRVLTLVGRSPWCRLGLTHAEVSKIHCGLLRTREGAWVIDCFGRGGTRVNGELIRWADLEDGDEIGVGPFLLRVRYGSSSNTAEAAPPPELVDPFLAQLTAQFGQMQQQMFDQFRQSMLMMAQMFGTLDRDQMDLVRDELARLHQINQDLTVLQAELAARPPSAPRPAAATPLQRRTTPWPGSRPCSRPVPRGLPIPLTRRGQDPSRSTRPPQSTASNGAHAAIRRGSTPTERLSPAAHPGGPSDDPIRTLLTQRIAALQQERQGHWQRVLSMMRGQ